MYCNAWCICRRIHWTAGTIVSMYIRWWYVVVESGKTTSRSVIGGARWGWGIGVSPSLWYEYLLCWSWWVRGGPNFLFLQPWNTRTCMTSARMTRHPHEIRSRRSCRGEDFFLLWGEKFVCWVLPQPGKSPNPLFSHTISSLIVWKTVKF